MVGKPFVDFDLEMVDGSKKKLSSFIGQGKPVVCDFYTSW